jgi:hypothetical protein
MTTHRVVTPIVFAAVIGLAVIGAGCGESPTQPTPQPPSPTANGVQPVPTSLTLQVVTPSSGPTSGADLVRVYGLNIRDGAIVAFDGVDAPVTRKTATYIEARTSAHAAGPVDVTVMNPDGETRTLTGSYTFGAFSISATPTDVSQGGKVTVSWQTPPGRGCQGGGDWIAIYRIGDPDETGAANGHSDLWYEHVCGVVSGSWTINLTVEPGVYEFRFMAGAGSVARSDAVTVTSEGPRVNGR